ncbi:PDR/VanB family oxidoreductase [Gordonia liuliyuniae]|uniref:PDR/VanB family oxidoreductase n=1 Tax=Gordonia liuliyuniae TaxID=2911517 RepID=A0ABS9IPG5_9ACTN|nr:PDR/VanB family oxidoreductase [Gordonia liuliyuniae]MCF8587456.1 PDR/VanB family oxidoreductase [Gordonia liuliyuniae]
MTGSKHLHETGLVVEPPHLKGRWQRDPLMRFLSGLGRVWFPAWAPVTRLRAVTERDGVQQLEIVRREVVAHDENVIALTFAAADRAVLPEWRAGAHLDLVLPSGRMREYSLCGDPGDRTTYRIAVRRIPDGGGGSVEVHDDLHVGDTVSIMGPRNAFPLALPGYGSPVGRLRFVAAGIGITPILPMVAIADRLGLDWTMIYTGRTLDSIPFREELARYGDRVQIRTDDEHGLPTMDDLIGAVGDGGVALYCCGPTPMLEGLRTRLVDRGDVELHYERFSPPPIENGTEFAIRLASTGETETVAADESMLTALRRLRPSTPYSCQQGFCGTCKLRVADGTVDHRDGSLMDTERASGYFLPCVSRCNSESLTIDV